MQQILPILLIVLSLNSADIHFGYGSDAMNKYNKKETMIAMEVWIQEIMQGDKDKVYFTFYDDSQKMAKEFEAAKLDMVVTYGLEFVKYFDKSQLISSVTGGSKNPQLDNFVLLVDKESSKEEFLALKNPKIAVPADEEISKIYVKHYFLKNTKKENIDFVNASKHQEAIFKLFFKNVDAALVSQKSFLFAEELNPQIGQNLKVIEYSSITSRGFAFFRKSMDEKVREKIIAKALALNSTNRGRQILDVFQTEEIIESTLDELSPIEQLYSDYKKLKKQNQGYSNDK